MVVEISNWNILKKLFPSLTFSSSDIEETIKRVFSEYNISSVGIIFTSKEYIQDLNMQYRGIDSVTDVLSFTLNTEPLVGEVYICPKYILENIPIEKFQEEILRNIVHGILHILGYDHVGEFTKENEKEEMFVKQEEILREIWYNVNRK
jgi:probable rRNA maturation factor